MSGRYGLDGLRNPILSTAVPCAMMMPIAISMAYVIKNKGVIAKVRVRSSI